MIKADLTPVKTAVVLKCPSQYLRLLPIAAKAALKCASLRSYCLGSLSFVLQAKTRGLTAQGVDLPP